MPASYRFEISANNRAGCQNKECKDAGLKIKKGELRFGTWVEFTLGERDIQAWKWRHWSCITPTVIQNLLKALGGLEGIEDDLNVIDGYDEMPQEWQEKILTMLREGHVPDEDWKGDVEQNRPGKRGSHKKATSTKKKTANESEGDNAEETPTKPKATRGRGKNVKTEANADSEGEDAGGMPTKAKFTKGRGKKVKPEANVDSEGEDAEGMHTKAKATKGRGKKVKPEANGDGEDKNAGGTHIKSKATKKRGKKVKTEANDEDEDENTKEMPTKAKATNGRGRRTKTEANGGDEDANTEGMPTKAKSTKGRGKKTKTEANNDDGDNVLLRGGGTRLLERRVFLTGAEAEDFAQKVRPMPKKRKASHLAVEETDEKDEEVPEEKPTKKPAKKIKVENVPEGQTVKAENNSLDGRLRRIAKSARKGETSALKKEFLDGLGEPEYSAEDSKEAVKLEQHDGAADLKIEVTVKTEPETITKTPASRDGGRPNKTVRKPRNGVKVEHAEKDAETVPDASAGPEPETEEAQEREKERELMTRRGKPKRGVKVEDEDEEVDGIVDVPTKREPEATSAPDTEIQTKPKAKAGRKRGVAKAISKPRIKPDY